MAVLDKQDYSNKAQGLLVEKYTYKPITGIPLPGTKINSSKFLGPLRLKADLSDSIYKTYPTGVVAPQVHGLPKIHKHGTP